LNLLASYTEKLTVGVQMVNRKPTGQAVQLQTRTLTLPKASNIVAFAMIVQESVSGTPDQFICSTGIFSYETGPGNVVMLFQSGTARPPDRSKGQPPQKIHDQAGLQVLEAKGVTKVTFYADLEIGPIGCRAGATFLYLVFSEP